MSHFFISLLLFSCTFFIIHTSQAMTQQSEMGFQLAFTGKAVLANEAKEQIFFDLAFEETNNNWYFRAGQSKLPMYLPPSTYNLQFAVDEQTSHVYLAEFSRLYMQSFLVYVGEHEIELIPAPDVQYGVRLRVDDRLMLFDKRTPTLVIQLDGYGITGFKYEGFIRDLSNRRVEQ